MKAEVLDNLFVNGKKIEDKVELNHDDRIIIGQSTVFLFKIPGEESTEDYDWEFA